MCKIMEQKGIVLFESFRDVCGKCEKIHKVEHENYECFMLNTSE